MRAPAAWSRTIICTTHMREGAEAVAKHTPKLLTSRQSVLSVIPGQGLGSLATMIRVLPRRVQPRARSLRFRVPTTKYVARIALDAARGPLSTYLWRWITATVACDWASFPSSRQWRRSSVLASVRTRCERREQEMYTSCIPRAEKKRAKTCHIISKTSQSRENLFFACGAARTRKLYCHVGQRLPVPV